MIVSVSKALQINGLLLQLSRDYKWKYNRTLKSHLKVESTTIRFLSALFLEGIRKEGEHDGTGCFS